MEGSDNGVSQSELLGFWTFSIVQDSIEYWTMEKVQKPSNSDNNIVLTHNRMHSLKIISSILRFSLHEFVNYKLCPSSDYEFSAL
jgi:hypothetical protein